MNSRILISTAISLVIFMTAGPAFAQVKPVVKPFGTSTRTHVASSTPAERQEQRQESATQRTANLQNRGTAAISKRVEDLNKLLTRIQGMKNLTDVEKSSFATTIQTEIATLTTLEERIQSDTSTTSLKVDLKTIAPDYRVYMLIMPQLSIMSAVDRINSLVTSLTTIQSKIQTRVSADATLSSNETIKSALADMTAKLTDAGIKTTAAQNEVANLKPDQGDQTIAKSNLVTLKDARSKIQAAQQDIVAIRKNARSIVDLIIKSDKSLRKNTSVGNTATTTN